jgi:hypothetical protein
VIEKQQVTTCHNRTAVFLLSQLWLVSLGAILFGGCSASELADPAAPAAQSQHASQLAEGETWDVLHVQGSKVGYIHTTARSIEEQGRKLIQTEADQRMIVKRFDDVSRPGVQLVSVETPDGQLVRFSSRQELGPQPEITTGRVEGSELLLTTETTGKTTESRIPWDASMGGFFVVEQSLLRKPMQPGESRALQGLAPMFHRPFRYQLQAGQKETTSMVAGSLELLKIEVLTTLPNDQTLRSTIWADERGETLKTYTADLKQETFRVTREVALDDSGEAFDLGETTIVKLDKPLTSAHRARQIRYRVTLDQPAGGDPAQSNPSKVFASGPTQMVRRTSDNSAEVIVKSHSSAQGVAAPLPAGEGVVEADRAPNNMIQSDHPRIVAMAKEAAGAETDPAKVAAALERHVKQSIKEVNFSQALGTAADVAQSGQGDCTEHAVLLAALARASGIPARVAIGLVYVDAYQGFGYHMWTEMHINDQWVAYDATLGQGGIGSGHLKLSHSNLAGGDAYASFLPVARVMGKLKIEVLEVQ